MNSAHLDHPLGFLLFLACIGVLIGVFVLAAKARSPVARIGLWVFGGLLAALFAWNIAVAR